MSRVPSSSNVLPVPNVDGLYISGSLLLDQVVFDARGLTCHQRRFQCVPSIDHRSAPLQLLNPSTAPASHGKVSVQSVPLFSGKPYSQGRLFPTPPVESQCQSCPVVRFQYQRSFPQQGPKHLDCSTGGLPFIVRSGFPYTVHPDPSSPSPLEWARRSVLS